MSKWSWYWKQSDSDQYKSNTFVNHFMRFWPTLANVITDNGKYDAYQQALLNTYPLTEVGYGSGTGQSSAIDPQLPYIQNGSYVDPTSAGQEKDQSLFNGIDFSQFGEYGDYLKMLVEASNIGLFSTAQDVSDAAAADRAYQAEQAQIERDWYTNMSNTSYQRQVADLEAAGLNPILGWSNMHTGAQVASTQVPQGRATNLSANAPNLADYMNAGANIISSAADIMNAIGNLWGNKIKKAIAGLYDNGSSGSSIGFHD